MSDKTDAKAALHRLAEAGSINAGSVGDRYDYIAETLRYYATDLRRHLGQPQASDWTPPPIPPSQEGRVVLVILKHCDREYYDAPVAATFWGTNLKHTYSLTRIELDEVMFWRECPQADGQVTPPAQADVGLELPDEPTAKALWQQARDVNVRLTGELATAQAEVERLRQFAQNILAGNYTMTPADVDRELRAMARAALGK